MLATGASSGPSRGTPSAPTRATTSAENVAVGAARERVRLRRATAGARARRSPPAPSASSSVVSIDEVECRASGSSVCRQRSEGARDQARHGLALQALRDGHGLASTALRQRSELVGLVPLQAVLRLRMADEVHRAHSVSSTLDSSSTSRAYVRRARASASGTKRASSTSLAAARSPATGLMSQ